MNRCATSIIILSMSALALAGCVTSSRSTKSENTTENHGIATRRLRVLKNPSMPLMTGRLKMQIQERFGLRRKIDTRVSVIRHGSPNTTPIPNLHFYEMVM